MRFDLDMVGAFVPGIAIWLVGGLLVFLGLDAILTRWGFYRLFWHPPLARFALFSCLVSGLGLIARM
jgi:Protein of unknown function (DUF1656)